MPSTARPAPTRVVSDVGGAALDAAFTLLGLVARPYLINGRQYHGRQGEFDLHVYVTTVTQSGSTGRAGYAGHDLTLCLVAPSHTRLSVSWNAGVAAWIDTRFRGRTAVPLHAAALEGLHVRAVDAAWAARFVESTATSLAALMTLPKGCGMVTFELQPGAMQFGLRCHWTTVSPALVATWVEHLHALASVIATLPAPEPRIVETSRDRHMVVRDESRGPATPAPQAPARNGRRRRGRRRSVRRSRARPTGATNRDADARALRWTTPDPRATGVARRRLLVGVIHSIATLGPGPVPGSGCA